MIELTSLSPVRRRLTPSRLALARRMRGLNQSALARELNISAAAINQFESGAAQPSADTIDRLAMALSVAPNFLMRPTVPDGGKPFFRGLSRVPAGERERAHAYALALSDVAGELECSLELPKLHIAPLLEAGPDTPASVVEAAANEARRNWGVADGPVADVVAMAESRGIVTAAVGDFHDGIDAFTVPGIKRPVVVLCSTKGVATRRRFDMAHELAHLTLHEQRDEEPRWQEQQAHRFASALLMPADDVADQLPRRGDDLRSLERVARTWGVSMQAALMRARDLGLLTPDEHRRGMKRLSAAGWRTREPVDVGPPERPRLLLAAVSSLPDAGTSFEALAETLGLPAGRLRRMLSLPEAHDDARVGELVQLHG
jgi:Zn-dependent peptidase ImmA (M78 family)/transcriptional regulator with XRE-family HTH domain